MQKGISQIVIIILILLIAVSLTSALYMWAGQTVFQIYPEDTQERIYMRERACLGVDRISNTQITINNCGLVPLKDFKIYVNGVNQNPSVPESLEPGESSDIAVNINLGQRVYVTSDYAESPSVIYSALPTCGNNIIEGDEPCDGTDLGGKTCADLGYHIGTLACLAGCSGFDTSNCDVTECVDTDGGLIYDVKGKIILPGGTEKTDHCKSGDRELREYNCTDGGEDFDDYICPTTCDDKDHPTDPRCCSDGVCIP